MTRRHGIVEKLKADAPKQLAANVDRDRAVVTLRSEKAALKRQVDELHKRLEKSEASRNALVSLSNVKAAKFKPPKRTTSTSPATALLVLSDQHVEEPVYPEQVNGLNEHNLDIAAKRSENTSSKFLMLLEDARHLANIREVVVALLGDACSGHIHPDLAESCLLAPLPAFRYAKKLIKAQLNQLLEHADADMITVVTARGNHGRSTEKSRIATAAENSFEQDMYLSLAEDYAREPRMRWQVGEGYHNWLTIQGRDFRFHHGEAIKYLGGIGGLCVPAQRKIAAWDRTRKAYMDVFGHHHEWGWYKKFVVNGSQIGYGAYGEFIGGSFEPPQQTFGVIDRTNGMVRCMPIFC